jgi:hypothetical protein
MKLDIDTRIVDRSTSQAQKLLRTVLATVEVSSLVRRGYR